MLRVFLIQLLVLLSLMTAAAKTSDFVCGGIRYVRLSANSVSVTVEQDSILLPPVLEIPSHVVYQGITFTVRGISWHAFWDCDMSGTKEVRIPHTVTRLHSSAFDCSYSQSGVLRFVVDSLNPVYCDVDGVIYTRDMKRLVRYPPARRDTIFDVPEGVEVISESAFGGAMSLLQVKLPPSVRTIESWAFASCKRLRHVNIPNGVSIVYDYAFDHCEKLPPAFCENPMAFRDDPVTEPLDERTRTHLLLYGGNDKADAPAKTPDEQGLSEKSRTYLKVYGKPSEKQR